MGITNINYFKPIIFVVVFMIFLGQFLTTSLFEIDDINSFPLKKMNRTNDIPLITPSSPNMFIINDEMCGIKACHNFGKCSITMISSSDSKTTYPYKYCHCLPGFYGKFCQFHYKITEGAACTLQRPELAIGWPFLGHIDCNKCVCRMGIVACSSIICGTSILTNSLSQIPRQSPDFCLKDPCNINKTRENLNVSQTLLPLLCKSIEKSTIYCQLSRMRLNETNLPKGLKLGKLCQQIKIHDAFLDSLIEYTSALKQDEQLTKSQIKYDIDCFKDHVSNSLIIRTMVSCNDCDSNMRLNMAYSNGIVSSTQELLEDAITNSLKTIENKMTDSTVHGNVEISMGIPYVIDVKPYHVSTPPKKTSLSLPNNYIHKNIGVKPTISSFIMNTSTSTNTQISINVSSAPKNSIYIHNEQRYYTVVYMLMSQSTTTTIKTFKNIYPQNLLPDMDFNTRKDSLKTDNNNFTRAVNTSFDSQNVSHISPFHLLLLISSCALFIVTLLLIKYRDTIHCRIRRKHQPTYNNNNHNYYCNTLERSQNLNDINFSHTHLQNYSGLRYQPSIKPPNRNGIITSFNVHENKKIYAESYLPSYEQCVAEK